MSTEPTNGAPRLSIVVPTLNRAGLVARALASALAQTAAGVEIIVSDNGSSDHTPEVLASFSDPRLRHIRHAHTMPAEEHGNFLIAQCRGEYFLGLSDDDHLEPDFAARVLALLDEQPQLAFVYTACLVHYADCSVPSLPAPRIEAGTCFLAAFYAGQREVCWCACVTRLADLRAIGPIPRGRIFGDMFYWTQLAFRGDVGFASRPAPGGAGGASGGGQALAHYTFMTADNLSSGVPAPAWAAETQLLADAVIQGMAAAEPSRVATLQADVRRFVARSTANQLVWNAMRGAGPARLWRDLGRCVRYLIGEPGVWPRALAALLMPAAWTRSLVLRAARRRGQQRRAQL